MATIPVLRPPSAVAWISRVDHGRAASQRSRRQRDESEERRQSTPARPSVRCSRPSIRNVTRAVGPVPLPEMAASDHRDRRLGAPAHPGRDRPAIEAAAVRAGHASRLRREIPSRPGEPPGFVNDDPADAVRADAAEVDTAGERPCVRSGAASVPADRSARGPSAAVRRGTRPGSRRPACQRFTTSSHSCLGGAGSAVGLPGSLGFREPRERDGACRATAAGTRSASAARPRAPG